MMKAILVGFLVVASISSVFCQVYSNKPCPTDRPVQEDFNITRVSLFFIIINYFPHFSRLTRKKVYLLSILRFMCPTFYKKLFLCCFMLCSMLEYGMSKPVTIQGLSWDANAVTASTLCNPTIQCFTPSAAKGSPLDCQVATTELRRSLCLPRRILKLSCPSLWG